MPLPTMITVGQLQPLLETPNVVVLDSRFYLDDHAKGRILYEQGHIPRALFIDLHHQLAGPETPLSGRHPLPEPAEFRATLADLGIGQGSQVVVYDDMGGAIAARAWWMMAQQGIHVRVLEGGLPAWQAANGVLETGTRHATSVIPSIDVSFPWQVTEDEVVSNFEADRFQLLDARAEDRFQGLNENIDPVAGHIPGAINRPFTSNLTDQGELKAPSVLLDEWTRVLAGVDQPVVYYCGSGVTACHHVLAMNYAGLEAKYVYVGSWSQWSKRMLRLLRG